MNPIQLALTIIVVIIMIYVAILIVSAVLEWYFSNQNNVNFAVNTICNLDQIILDSINETFVRNLENEQAKEIGQRILQNEKISDCDYKLFLDLLDDENRKKLNLKDFACNFSSCLNP